MSMSRFRTNKIRPTVLYSGQVIDNQDPEQLGRIRVKIPGVLDFKEPEHYPWCIPDWHHVDGSTNWSGSFDVPKLNAVVGIWFQESPDVEGSAYHPIWTAHNLFSPQILRDAKHHYPNRKVHRFANGAHAVIDTEDDSVWLYNPGETHAKSQGKLCIKSEETFVILSDVEVGVRAPEIALRAKDHLILESENRLTMRCKGRMNIESRDDIQMLARQNVKVTAAERNIELLARADTQDSSNVLLTANKDHVRLVARGQQPGRQSNVEGISRKNHVSFQAQGALSPAEESSFLVRVNMDRIVLENRGPLPSSTIRIEHLVHTVTIRAGLKITIKAPIVRISVL
jgi:hypothetical protein